MTPILPTIRRMTFQEVFEPGLKPGELIFEHNSNSYCLNAGLSDTIHIFTKSIYLYVLTINKPLGYIGLDLYFPSEEDPINSIFLHSDYQITDALGPKWMKLTPGTIASRLIDHLN